MNIFIYGAPYKNLIINVSFVQNHFQEVGRWQFTWKIYMHKVDIYDGTQEKEYPVGSYV